MLLKKKPNKYALRTGSYSCELEVSPVNDFSTLIKQHATIPRKNTRTSYFLPFERSLLSMMIFVVFDIFVGWKMVRTSCGRECCCVYIKDAIIGNGNLCNEFPLFSSAHQNNAKNMITHRNRRWIVDIVLIFVVIHE